MELSDRLQAISGMVQYHTVADIGTDHGYVPVKLFLEGRLKKGIACDIHKGPLEKARRNIQLYGAADRIETRLGDGLVPIQQGEIDAIILAGMGGMLVSRILLVSADVVKCAKQLILQPQLDIDVVRKTVHQLGFKISDEEMLIEDGKYYTILNCLRGEEFYSSDLYYKFGKCLIEKKHPVLKEYLDKKRKDTIKILTNLNQVDTEKAKERRKTCEAELCSYEEVLKCL